MVKCLGHLPEKLIFESNIDIDIDIFNGLSYVFSRRRRKIKEGEILIVNIWLQYKLDSLRQLWGEGLIKVKPQSLGVIKRTLDCNIFRQSLARQVWRFRF